MTEKLLVKVRNPVGIGDLRVVGRLELLVHEGIPVDIREPRMTHHLLHVFGSSQPLLLVSDQKLESNYGYFIDEVFTLIGDDYLIIVDEAACLDDLHQHLIILRIEWRESIEEFVGQDPQTPPVGWLRMAFRSDDFWS